MNNNELTPDEMTNSESISSEESAVNSKKKLTDSPGWAVLETLFYLVAGSTIANILIGLISGVVLLATGICSIDDMLHGNIPAVSSVAETALQYFESGAASFLILPFLYLIKGRRPIAKAMGPAVKGNTVKNFLTGIVIGGALNAFCCLCAVFHKDVQITFDSFNLLGLLLVFVCVFFQSSFEEFMCRGVLYQMLMKRFQKPIIAIVGNAMLFALLHLGNDGVTILSLINIVVVGIFFSLMVYYLDSIWCAMATHTAWNFTQNIIFGLPNSGNMTPFSIFKLDTAATRNSIFYDAGFGVEGTLMCDIVLIIGCILLYLYGRKKNLKPTNIWEDTFAQN